MADVIAKDCVLILLFSIGRCCCLCCGRCCNHIWADVICQVADGIATFYNRWQVLLPSGRCYSHRLCANLYLSSRVILLPDIVVDVKTTYGRCYLPSARWNGHIVQQVANVIAEWQML